ncbi:MAG: FKBP-type peptidyl-prolyl cis-trans isomerase [Bdellovibrionaceae bacterium]|nr:FKBP-type peptidyl-prolyl cis-trans isomerase [Pseudobdellovibrionaceae bacterium]
MNKFVFVISAAALVMAGCTKKLDTDEKRASYAIGQQIGNNLKQQSISIDPAMVALALEDIKAGKQSRLSQEEIQQAMMKLQEMAQKKQQEEANANLAKAEAFLQQNKTQPNVQTTPSGLQYVVLKEGSGKSPTDNDNVKAHYMGTLIDGTKFDSSYDRGQPAEFPVRGVIPGWSEALKMMKPGGKMKLFIPPALAYGPSGRPGIPPNSALIFEVELLEVITPKTEVAPKKK